MSKVTIKKESLAILGNLANIRNLIQVNTQVLHATGNFLGVYEAAQDCIQTENAFLIEDVKEFLNILRAVEGYELELKDNYIEIKNESKLISYALGHEAATPKALNGTINNAFESNKETTQFATSITDIQLKDLKSTMSSIAATDAWFVGKANKLAVKFKNKLNGTEATIDLPGSVSTSDSEWRIDIKIFDCLYDGIYGISGRIGKIEDTELTLVKFKNTSIPEDVGKLYYLTYLSDE
jgi:hypothetical protein